MRNIILTGIPRSGTTLAAANIDAAPDSVCLNEPEWHRPHPELNAEKFAEAVALDFENLRQKLLAGEPVPDRRGANGDALTNYFEDGKNYQTHPLVRNDLSENFTLAIKHNGSYLAVLTQLIALKKFEVRVVIRHPLEVLRSWRRLDLPVSRGELPNATPYWPEIKKITEMKIDLMEKQARMIDAMFARIRACESGLTLLRYEEFAEDKISQRSAVTSAEDGELRYMLEKFAPHAKHYYTL